MEGELEAEVDTYNEIAPLKFQKELSNYKIQTNCIVGDVTAKTAKEGNKKKPIMLITKPQQAKLEKLKEDLGKLFLIICGSEAAAGGERG